MSRKIAIAVLLLMAVGAARAEVVAINPDNPGTYTVVKGDTLWDIAGRFLRHPWQWPEVWQVNPQIGNPHLIYPGDQISLSYRDGRPILGLVAGRTLKLSPSIRETRHTDAITAIPLDAIQQFLSRPLVVDEATIRRSAYVVSSQDQHLATGSGDRIYIRGIGEPTTANWSVFRQGGRYVDPDTGEFLGYEALHIGDVVIERLGDPATAYVVKSNREILNGDRLMPQTEDEYPDFFPHAPADVVDGRIISVVDGVSQIGQYQVVVLNRGHSDGLEPGHVLAIHQAGAVVEDELGTEIAALERDQALLRDAQEETNPVGQLVKAIGLELLSAKRGLDRAFGETPGGAPVLVQLPEERAGELMVFRTFDSVSYGLVMNTQRPVHVEDKIRNP